MPINPSRPCRYPGCNALTKDKSGYCINHILTDNIKQKARNKRYDNARPSASKRGYDARWQRLRRLFLKEHPICECYECKRLNRLRVANVIHHIVPVDKRPDLRLSLNNLLAVNRECHEIMHGRKR